MAHTVEDLFNQGTQIQASIAALAMGQAAPVVPATGPISLTQANQEVAANSKLTYSFDGKNFTFSLQGAFGVSMPMVYTTPWNGQL